MRPLLTFCLLLLCGSAVAQGLPNIAQEEIARRGDFVEVIGVNQAIGQAFSPPQDDSHKWFVTIITKQGCLGCDQLLRDFQIDPHLKAYADPRSPQNSWAHFNVYDAADQTQSWRWAGIKIKLYPTIVVQPPRNGAYGDPSTVVLQLDGYGGDAKATAADLRAGIVRYIQATTATHQQLFPRRPGLFFPNNPRPNVNPLQPDVAPVVDPPFTPPVIDTVPPVTTLPPPPLEAEVPKDEPVASAEDEDLPGIGTLVLQLIRGLLSGDGINYVTLAVVALLAFRQYRIANGKAPILSEKQLGNVIDGIFGVEKQVSRLRKSSRKQ